MSKIRVDADLSEFDSVQTDCSEKESSIDVDDVDNEVQLVREVLTRSNDKPDLDFDVALPEDEETLRLVSLAAAHVDTAFRGKIYYAALETGKPWQLTVYRWRSNLTILIDLVVVALIILTFFERPSWCYVEKQVIVSTMTPITTTITMTTNLTMTPMTLTSTNVETVDFCDSVPSSKLPRLSKLAGQLIEILLLLIISLDVVASFCIMRLTRWFKGWHRVLRTILIVISLFDIIILDAALPERTFRIAPHCRPLILVTSMKSIKAVLYAAMRSLPRLAVIGVLQLLWIVFAAWCGLILFKDVGGNSFFGDLGASIWSMLVLSTTANYPDVALPAFQESILYTAFFIVFLAISLWLLMNLALGAIFAEYTNAKAERERNRFARSRRASLRRAFAVLHSAQTRQWGDIELQAVSADATLSVQSFAWLVLALNKFWRVPRIDPATTKLYFQSCDMSGSNTINVKEFQKLGQVVELTFDDLRKRSWLHRKLEDENQELPQWYQTFSNIVQSEKFDLFIDFLIVVNILLTALELWIDELSLWPYYELIFVILYMLDQIAKIIAKGSFMAYWRGSDSSFHRFDLVICSASLIAEIMVRLPNNFDNRTVVRLLQLMRVARLLRLMRAVPVFRTFATTYVSLMPRILPVVGFLVAVMLQFGFIGIELFGGLPVEAFAGTSYAGANYFSLNFNDGAATTSILFALIVVNNWFVFADGFGVASGTMWARAYFVVFWISGVLIGLNIVVATIIDQFSRAVDDDAASSSSIDPRLLTGIDGLSGDDKLVHVRRRARVGGVYLTDEELEELDKPINNNKK